MFVLIYLGRQPNLAKWSSQSGQKANSRLGVEGG